MLQRFLPLQCVFSELDPAQVTCTVSGRTARFRCIVSCRTTARTVVLCPAGLLPEQGGPRSRVELVLPAPKPCGRLQSGEVGMGAFFCSSSTGALVQGGTRAAACSSPNRCCAGR